MVGVIVVAEFDALSNEEALEVSIRAASHLSDQHHAAVEAARVLARRVDVLAENDWVVEGKLDNVSMPSYLRALQALGLLPSVEAAGSKEKPRDELEAFKERARLRRID